MDIRKLQRAIVDGLEDVKAVAIAVFNTEALSPLFERVVIATGASNRQTKALAASVRDAVRSRGMQVMRTEGEENGEWIIVDCGAAVVHIMQPAIREYYHLEEIWGGKPVKMKFGDTQAARLVKASEEPPHAAGAAVSSRYLGPAKQATPSKAPTRKAPARGAAAKTGAAQTPAARKRRSGPGQAAPAKALRKVVVGAKPAARRSAAAKAGAPKRRA
jgi:ribosome-associated protein